MQAVGVDVLGTEQIANAVRAFVARTQPLWPFARCPARAVVGDQLDRTHLVEAHHHAVLWLGSVERKNALGLLGEIRSGLHFQERVRWCDRPAPISVSRSASSLKAMYRPGGRPAWKATSS